MGEGRGSGSARPSRATKSRHPSLHLNAAQQLVVVGARARARAKATPGLG